MIHDYYSKLSHVLEVYYNEISTNKYKNAQRDISAYLSEHANNFEGKALPVSLQPLVFTKEDMAPAIESGAYIREVLEHVIQKFSKLHLGGVRNSLLHRFFVPYQEWWDIISKEHRRISPIQIMRYDAIREPAGDWKFMETNTACPGGVISCAYARKAWLSTDVGRTITRNVSLVEHQINNPSAFILFMTQCAQFHRRTSPINLAICNYKKTYTNELQELKLRHERLVQENTIPPGELFLCDIREIYVKDNVAMYNGNPLHIIHNKLDPLMINPQDAEIEGWIRASQCHETDFLNSLGAMYLTEAKRIFALLYSPHMREMFVQDDYTRSILDRYIPYTRLLNPIDDIDAGYTCNIHTLLRNQQHQFVLKADALTRGQGVFIGKNVSRDKWINCVEDIKRKHGVMQLCCNTPSREASIINEDEISSAGEYYGVDFFFFGKNFAGPMSRVHSDIVFNVGNGGKIAPTLVI